MFKQWIVCCFLCIWLAACQTTTPEPKLDPSKRLMAANYNVQLGVGYLAQGETIRAKGKLLLALQQAPEWAPAYDAMALFLERTGEAAEAKKYYLKAIALSPNSGAAHNNYGTYLCRQRQIAASIVEFKRAVRDSQYLSPGEAFENAGLCSLAAKDDKNAFYYFTKAVKREPRRSTSWIELARLSIAKRNFVAAKYYLRESEKYTGETTESRHLAERLPN